LCCGEADRWKVADLWRIGNWEGLDRVEGFFRKWFSNVQEGSSTLIHPRRYGMIDRK
jgi:hypothetical protein